MRHALVFLALVLIIFTADAGSAERLWVNDITIDEYNMTWGYTETFTGTDSSIYRTDVDTEFGDNDSFITAWELLKLDKEMRNRLRSSIDSEFDVRIETPETPYLNTGTNGNNGIEMVDVDSALSPGIIGKTNISDAVVNRYKVTYRLKGSIFNARGIWFLGQARSPVTVILPAGVDVTNISGMDNVTKIVSDHTEISGVFRGVSGNASENRGEITLGLSKNTTAKLSPEVYILNVTIQKKKPADIILSKIRDASILGFGVILILLIYVFRIRKR